LRQNWKRHNWKDWLHRALGIQLTELRRALTAVPPINARPSIWYVGLAAEPVEFSRQLAALHSSIQLENQRSRVGQVPGVPPGFYTR
jgi:hypothetical protein